MMNVRRIALSTLLLGGITFLAAGCGGHEDKNKTIVQSNTNMNVEQWSKYVEKVEKNRGDGIDGSEIWQREVDKLAAQEGAVKVGLEVENEVRKGKLPSVNEIKKMMAKEFVKATQALEKNAKGKSLIEIR